ncbi:hypothetical protein ACS7ZM_002833, partial [Enterococcus faecalis]
LIEIMIESFTSGAYFVFLFLFVIVNIHPHSGWLFNSPRRARYLLLPLRELFLETANRYHSILI